MIKLKLSFKEIEKLLGQLTCGASCNANTKLMDDEVLSSITNHPPHIVDGNRTLSPSAFIPFCWFGDGLELGTMVPGFSTPICTNFSPVIRNDQICYEIDPKDIIENKMFSEDNLREGLMLLIDENQDRQSVRSNDGLNIQERNDRISHHNSNGFLTSIFLDAISKFKT